MVKLRESLTDISHLGEATGVLRYFLLPIFEQIVVRLRHLHYGIQVLFLRTLRHGIDAAFDAFSDFRFHRADLCEKVLVHMEFVHDNGCTGQAFLYITTVSAGHVHCDYLNICVVIDHVFYRMQDCVALVVLAHFQQAAAFTVHKDRTHIVYNVFFVDTEYPWRNDWAALGLQLRAVVVEYSSDSGDGITVFFRDLGERVPKRISLYQLKKPVCHLPVFEDAFRYICKCLFARIAEVSFYLQQNIHALFPDIDIVNQSRFSIIPMTVDGGAFAKGTSAITIAQNTRNDIFAVETAEGSYRPLFEAISTPVEPSNRNNFAKNIFGIIAQDKFDFSSAFAGSFDFYSTIFEYLIKDYNVASGVYAEYFTPQSVSSIIARCLVGMSDKVEASEISDPAAGSGSLVLHLAHELGQENGLNRAIVYTQDISSKSTRFLRLNMMLNGMTESLGHIIQGDTLLNPAHFQVEHEPTSGLKKYAYQTANPPFKLDFSSTRDAIEQKWSETDRFFAGVPKIPASKKESMAIYLLFIQHIMYCMKDNGKAAIVVPTGFLTAKSKIEYAIRQRMVDKHIIKGVISMPSNIFANTGTNVSILFLDNANAEEEAFLVDASSLGKKVKDGKNQRTVLSDEEVNRIIDVFTNRKVEDDFSVSVPYDDMTEKGCSFSAGQYFEVKIEHIDITPEEFNANMAARKERLTALFAKGHELETSIMEQMKEVYYGK